MATKNDKIENKSKICSFDYCNESAIKGYCFFHTCKTIKCYALVPNNYNHCIRHTCGFPNCRQERDMGGLWILIGTSPSQFMSYYCEEHENIELPKWSYKNSENSP